MKRGAERQISKDDPEEAEEQEASEVVEDS